MIYIRNIFTQDLTDGKQIAFTKEPSNVFFEFDFRAQDPDRKISFTFKEDNTTSDNYRYDNVVINTRLYAVKSEARIDSELKVFLINRLKASIGDIIIFSRKRSLSSFEFKFIPQKSSNYSLYKTFLNGGNHEVIIAEKNLNPEKNINYNFLHEFSDWLIQYEGVKHNYLKDSFGLRKEDLIEELEVYETIYMSQFKNEVFSFPISELEDKIIELENNLYLGSGDFFDFSSKISNHMPRAILGKKNYLSFLKNKQLTKLKVPQIDFEISQFKKNINNVGLIYSGSLITRYISSLATKPFVLLSGLSGSGKTKLAQSFAQWICETEKQYCIVPVGADWTNREPLLGYVNALDNNQYILPENGALQLLIDANKNQNKPYFLILDEMNLSHVERYFADFLSVMESKDKFKLHSDKEKEKSGVPFELGWPKNLFVVGTVNIDETTYMFSPKVLDRANVIEFRINETEMSSYLTEATEVTDLNGEGKNMGESFVTIATEKTKANSDTLKTTLNNFFSTLQEVGAEFGYRTASEIQTLFGQIDVVNPTFSEKENEKIDIAVMQKLLPKLHGSRSKLTPVLKTLATLCYQNNKGFITEQKDKIFETVKDDTRKVRYPISLEKVTRMYNNVIANGFTSYAEA